MGELRIAELAIRFTLVRPAGEQARWMQMAALIALRCVAHVLGSSEPLITTVEGVWAYCAGGAAKDHDWQSIEPTPLELVQAGMGGPSPQPAS